MSLDGIKKIEDIQVGDWVIADDPSTPGEVLPRQVLQTFIRETDVLYDLYVDGEVISTTGEHPFWVPDKGWVEAQDLIVGDWLQTDAETTVDVDRIERREGHFSVYNFEVEGFHTYFVSDLGILVHNATNDYDNFLHPDPDSLLTKQSDIAKKFGLTIDQVDDAIHQAKEDPIVRANKKRNNPDVGVDPDGEIFIQIGKGKFSGDSIGNIKDPIL